MSSEETLLEFVQKVSKMEQSLVDIYREIKETKTFVNDLSHQVTERNDMQNERILKLENMKARYGAFSKLGYLIIAPVITFLVAYGLSILGIIGG